MSHTRYRTLTEFYPYYLQEHANRTCRRLHFVGTSLVLAIALYALVSQQWSVLWLMPLAGYFFAWVGHFFFEHNKPATFQYPLFSLASDFIMYKDMLTGKIRF